MSDILTEEELLALINEDSEEEETKILSEDELLALLSDDEVLTEEQILSLLAEAPDDDIPQVGSFDEYAASHEATKRADLEQQQAQANAVQANAGDKLAFAELPAHERAAASGMEGVQAAIQMPAMMVNAPSMIGRIMGMDTPNIIPTDMQHTPEGSTAQTLGRMGGDAMSMGMGFMPVARVAGKSSSVVADVMGLGASTDDAAKIVADQAARNAQRLPTPEFDTTTMTKLDLRNGEQLLDVAAKAQDEVNEMRLADEFADMDAIDAQATKSVNRADEKFKLSDGDAKAERNMQKSKRRAARKKQERQADLEARYTKGKQAPYGGAMAFGNEMDEGVIEHLARRFDLPRQEVTEALIREGGIPQPETLKEARRRRYAAEAADMYQTTGHSKKAWDEGEEVFFGWYNEIARPATALLRENVGAGFASMVERSYIDASGNAGKLVMKYQGQVDEFRGVVEWAEQPAIQKQFMDMFKTGIEGRAKILQQAREALTPEQYDVFDQFVEDAYKYQEEAGGLFRADQLLDEAHWGINKSREKAAPGTSPEDLRDGMLPNAQNPKKTADSMMERTRGLAAKMGAGELEQYDNVIMSMFTRMTQDQDLIALAKHLKIPPSMLVGDNIGAMTGAIFKHVESVTGSTDKAAAAARIVGDIMQGSRQRPNQAIRTFMNQSYGVSLGQWDSAFLNIHDVFNSMNHQGVMPTISALIDGLRGKGFDVRDFGITDATIGEFKDGMGTAFARESKTIGDKAEKITAAYADTAFTWSAFKSLDLGGKGVIMRATMKDMQRLAATPKGMQKLRKKYGHLLSDRELGEVARVLKSKTPLSEMSQRQRNIMGNAMTGRLAEQQLVSQASRPLQYLKNPNYRPFWQMAGFAVRQADRLKQQVYDEVVAGNYKEAGNAFARFLVFNVGGFVIADSIRDMPAAALAGKENKEINLENTRDRAIEAVAGPVTMNKMGSKYDMEQAWNNGPEYLADAAMPARGGIDHLWAATKLALTGEFEKAGAEISNIIPGGGRLLSDIWEYHIKEAEKNDPTLQREKQMEAQEKRRERQQEQRR